MFDPAQSIRPFDHQTAARDVHRANDRGHAAQILLYTHNHPRFLTVPSVVTFLDGKRESIVIREVNYGRL